MERMWIPRLIIGLAVLYSIGRVKAQPPQQTDQPPQQTGAVTGIPNLNRFQLINPSFTSTLFAFVAGYTTTRVLDPTSGADIKRCPKGWLKRLNRCYYFSNRKNSWYGAEERCRLMGGYLAIPDTEAENNVLKELSRSERTRLAPGLTHIPHFSRWIGIRSVDDMTVTKIISNESPTFTNFVAPEPNPNIAANMCTKLDDDTDFTWALGQCFRTFFFICERKLEHPFKYNI